MSSRICSGSRSTKSHPLGGGALGALLDGRPLGDRLGDAAAHPLDVAGQQRAEELLLAG